MKAGKFKTRLDSGILLYDLLCLIEQFYIILSTGSDAGRLCRLDPPLAFEETPRQFSITFLLNFDDFYAYKY